jgi:hypothetical protein
MLEQMPKRPRDAKQLAKMIVDLSTGDEQEPEMNVKQKAGQLGGLKGGKARAEKLTPEQRSEIARKAAQKRWTKH